MATLKLLAHSAGLLCDLGSCDGHLHIFIVMYNFMHNTLFTYMHYSTFIVDLVMQNACNVWYEFMRFMFMYEL